MLLWAAGRYGVQPGSSPPRVRGGDAAHAQCPLRRASAVHNGQNHNRGMRRTVMNDVLCNEAVLLVEIVAARIQVALEAREIAA